MTKKPRHWTLQNELIDLKNTQASPLGRFGQALAIVTQYYPELGQSHLKESAKILEEIIYKLPASTNNENSNYISHRKILTCILNNVTFDLYDITSRLQLNEKENNENDRTTTFIIPENKIYHYTLYNYNHNYQKHMVIKS